MCNETRKLQVKSWPLWRVILFQNLSMSRSNILRSMKGTPHWMAPEVIRETGHGRKSDIWWVSISTRSRVPQEGSGRKGGFMLSCSLGDRPIPLGDRPISLGDRSILLGDRLITLGDRPIPLGDRQSWTTRIHLSVYSVNICNSISIGHIRISDLDWN